jgi:hypothetical protein
VKRLRPLVPALGLVALVAVAPMPASAQAVDKTRVYVVVIDGLNIEEVPLMPFLSSLVDEGHYYPESRGVMVAETLPNHMSMVTGQYADRTGIVGNNFPDPETGEVVGVGAPEQLQADSLFTLVEKQCPQLTTAAVTSKDDLFTILQHDRTGDGEPDVDSNFANLDDPTFIPGLGLTPDERTIMEATRVSQELDPDFMFVNLGSVDRVGHVDAVGGATTPTGSRPAVRDVQRTLTDTNLRLFVEQLKQDGRWDSTALIFTADHSMDWSLPTSTVSLFPQFEDDPLLAGEVFVAQNGGAALYSLLDRESPQADARLARMREIAVATEGVDEALFREPNPLAGGEEFFVGRVHPDWRQTHPRSGDLLITVDDGLRVTEPGPFSNPIPGNHGMSSTLRVPVLVSGGLDVVQRAVAPTTDDPFVRSPDQAENVDMAPTAAWLLGVESPTGGFAGRALEEAFSARPEPACVSAAAAAPGAQVPGPAATSSTQPAPSGPATAAPTRRLPATGPVWVLPVAGVLLAAGAVALRRRSQARA